MDVGYIFSTTWNGVKNNLSYTNPKPNNPLPTYHHSGTPLAIIIQNAGIYTRRRCKV